MLSISRYKKEIYGHSCFALFWKLKLKLLIGLSKVLLNFFLSKKTPKSLERPINDKASPRFGVNSISIKLLLISFS